MISENRRAFILSQIEKKGSASVIDLALELHVSEMTVRRDLIEMENEGLIRRVHGGAVSARGRSYEPSLLMRVGQQSDAKKRIGQMAAQMILDGDSVALDIGTTTLEIAQSLQNHRNLTIITPSLHIANLLYNRADIRVILPGGILRQGEASLIGSLAQKAFEGLFVDRLFLAVGGIDAQAGFTEYNWDDALIKQAMIRSAKEVIVVADQTKFNRVAFARVAGLKEVHHLVTDAPPPPDLAARLDELNITIHVARDGR